MAAAGVKPQPHWFRKLGPGGNPGRLRQSPLERTMFESWTLIGLFAMLVAATVIDLRTAKIPNWLTLPGILVGLATQAFSGGWIGFVSGLQGLGLGLGLFAILYWLGGMGAGDVKLMGAIGSAIGSSGIFAAVMAIGCVGGVCAVYVILRDLGWRTALYGAGAFLGFCPSPCGNLNQRLSFRFGPVIALGTMLSVMVR